MRLTSLLWVPLLVILQFGCSRQPPSEPLLGVWKVTREVDLTDHTVTDPENSHYLFTKAHIMTGGGKEVRPIVEKNFAHMTHGEILSQLPTGAGFMKYEIKDGKIHRTVLWALSEFFEGKTIVTEFEVTSDSLILRDDHHADGHLREWHMTRVE